MRGNSNNMASVKTILKILQENFCTIVHTVAIIKPDNFWQKQRASISSHKYKFETTTISIESLAKVADPSQLTFEFDGTFAYEHAQWIDIRMALEEFMWQVGDMLDRIDDLQEDLARSNLADDVTGAKSGIDHHADMNKRIIKLPIEELDLQGEKLLLRINSGGGGGVGVAGNSGGAAGGSSQEVRTDGTSSSSSSSDRPANADMHSMLQQVLQQLESVHKGKLKLHTLWQMKKNKLDQCFQLRLFEQDCEKMFDWILTNRDEFQKGYVDIGHDYSVAKRLQDEHQKFTLTSMHVSNNINRILAVAHRLKEGIYLIFVFYSFELVHIQF